MMGNDKVRMDFFKAFVRLMRRKDPKFGRGCYVDSTPLPNQITNNPFNALSCHGISSSQVQTRLVLVLDEKTGLPVWYDIIPGNLLDLSTIMNTINDVAASLDIEIESLVLDAGYVCRPLIEAFHIGSGKGIISRMPARRGYPYKDLYWQFKDQFNKGKYQFIRKDHTYFGRKKKITLFGKHEEYAHVYVDHNNALLSNIDTTPEDLLYRYFCRTEIETVFKTSKEYLELLPLSKWTDQTVRGKILHDIIDTIVLLLVRKEMEAVGISTSRLFGKTQSLMCFKNHNEEAIVEVPNKKVKEYYKLLEISIPNYVDLKDEKHRILGKM